MCTTRTSVRKWHKDRGLLYRTGTAAQLVDYTDADWTGNVSDRRSMSTCAFSLGSVAIAWSSKTQPTVALLSTEVDYRGAAIATCKAIWLKRLLKDLQVDVYDLTTIYYDNLSNIQLAKNPVFHARTSTLRCTIISYESVSFQVKSNYSTFRQIGRRPTSSPSPLV